MIRFEGKGLSPGLAQGSAYVYVDVLESKQTTRPVPEQLISAEYGRIGVRRRNADGRKHRGGWVHSTADAVRAFGESRKRSALSSRAMWEKRFEAAATGRGGRVRVFANAGSREDVEWGSASGAEGFGTSRMIKNHVGE